MTRAANSVSVRELSLGSGESAGDGRGDDGRRDDRSRDRLAPDDWAAARSFYGDALGGRQLWPTERAAAGASVCFLVGETLVEVTADRGDAAAPLVLEVDAPFEWAERCWDAGFTVCVSDDGAGGGPAVSVLDPFGRRIDLRWRTTTTLNGADGGRPIETEADLSY